MHLNHPSSNPTSASRRHPAGTSNAPPLTAFGHGGPSENPRLLAAALAAMVMILAPHPHAADLPVLTSGHTDVGVNYEDGAWSLHVHAEDLGKEYEPDAVWLKVGSSALSQVPTNAAFSFLGTSGTPIWVLPAVQQHDLLFLGLGTEEMASGIFSNDTV